MKLNNRDCKQLKEIIKGLELTLDFTDLYITNEMIKNLKRIIRKLKI